MPLSSSLFVHDTWINPGVENVHRQIDEDEEDGHHEDRSLDKRKVAGLYGLDGQATQSGPGKDCFGDYRPPPSKRPVKSDTMVTTGISAFVKACFNMTFFSLKPFMRAVRI